MTTEMLSLIETEPEAVTGFRTLPLGYEATGAQYRRAAVPGPASGNWCVLVMTCAPNYPHYRSTAHTLQNVFNDVDPSPRGSIMRAVFLYVEAMSARAWVQRVGDACSVHESTALIQATSKHVARIATEASKSRLTETFEVVDVAERLAAIRDQLSLNISQLAKVIGVGRKTIYQWLTKEVIPRTTHQRRIKNLYDLALEWQGMCSAPVGELLATPVTNGASLLDALSRSSSDQDSLVSDIMQQLRAAILKREEKALPAWGKSGLDIARERRIELPDEETQLHNIQAAVLRARAERS